MSEKLIYSLNIGGEQISNKNRTGDRWMSSLTVDSEMNGIGSECVVELVAPDEALPKGNDPLEVKMDAGDGEKVVFKGNITQVRVTPVSQIVTATTGFEALAQVDYRAVYENSSVDFIVKELIQQGGLQAGTIETGPELSGYVLFEGPRVLGHIRRLADLSSKDYYTDLEGKFCFTGPDTKGETHTFQYGLDVYELDLKQNSPVFDGVEVTGEGAAGTEGAEKYYWLSDDLSGVCGKASLDDKGNVTTGKSGKRVNRFFSGALRSQEAAENIAESYLKKVYVESVKGRLKAHGRLGIAPGDRVKFSDFPTGHAYSKLLENSDGLRVRHVRLLLNSEDGFVTYLNF